MNITIHQARLIAAKWSAVVATVGKATLEAFAQKADLCIVSTCLTAHDKEGLSSSQLEALAKHIAESMATGQDAPMVLMRVAMAPERGEKAVAVAVLLHKGVVSYLPAQGGWSLLSQPQMPSVAVCLDHKTLQDETMPFDGVEAIVCLDATPYSESSRANLFSHCVAAVRQYARPIVRVGAVGGYESRLWSGDSLVLSPSGAYYLPAWEEVSGSFALSPWGGALTEVSEQATSLDPIVDKCQGIILGLRHMVHDNGFSKVILGLSGGMDSALTATFAVNALGASNVLGVIMSSPWTSKASVNDALCLASNLGMETLQVPISPLMQSFDKALAERFIGTAKGLTEENIQARIRSTLLMAIANKENRLLLATGNKSELAVGYCTLYGDMTGAFAPIGDVYKTDVYKLAYHMNTLSSLPVIPANVFSKAPSAELRPNQKDQDSLPPYDVLDEILYNLIEKHVPPHALQGDKEVVSKVLQLVHTSAFKRRQAPPALFVSDCPLAHWV